MKPAMKSIQPPPPLERDRLEPHQVHQRRRGLERLWYATGYSLRGLRDAWEEMAFRQEVLAALVLLPLAVYLGQSWLERAALGGVVLLVLIVELLNTAVEAAIDRIDPAWHPLSRQAKDLGSAAVLVSLVLAAFVWASALYSRFA